MEQWIYGGGIILLFLLAFVVALRINRIERRRLRDALMKQLDDLIISLESYSELDDLLSLMDTAELLARHVQHVDPIGFDAHYYRELLSQLRSNAIITKVTERVYMQVNEMRSTVQPGTRMRFGSAAEALLTRWMAHPALNAAQRQSLQTRLREVEEELLSQSTTAAVHQGLHHERNGRFAEAIQAYRRALEELEQLERLRTDEQNLVADLERRITAMEAKLNAAQAQPAEPKAG